MSGYRRLLLACVLGFGCTSDEYPPLELAEDGDGDGGDGDDDGKTDDGGDDADDGAYDDARLEVFEPEGASIHLIGEPVPFLAEVRDAGGTPLPYTQVLWSAGFDEPTLLQGLDGEVVLDPGIYDITAVANLPNGDRLQTQIGDVRVQSRWTGAYEGDARMVLSVNFQGFPLSPVCSGPMSMRVGFDGRELDIEGGSCTIDVIITQFSATYTITGELTDTGTGSGTISYDFGGLFGLDMDWEGAFVEHGFAAGFSGTTSIPLAGSADVSGSLLTTLVDPYIDE